MERRFDRQPALGRLAETICIYDKTDGFCSPRSKEVCKCWDDAEKMLHGSGLSARACCWVLMNKDKIEAEAARSTATWLPPVEQRLTEDEG